MTECPLDFESGEKGSVHLLLFCSRDKRRDQESIEKEFIWGSLFQEVRISSDRDGVATGRRHADQSSRGHSTSQTQTRSKESEFETAQDFKLTKPTLSDTLWNQGHILQTPL